MSTLLIEVVTCRSLCACQYILFIRMKTYANAVLHFSHVSTAANNYANCARDLTYFAQRVRLPNLHII